MLEVGTGTFQTPKRVINSAAAPCQRSKVFGVNIIQSLPLPARKVSFTENLYVRKLQFLPTFLAVEISVVASNSDKNVIYCTK
jgi:hypothetical protein